MVENQLPFFQKTIFLLLVKTSVKDIDRAFQNVQKLWNLIKTREVILKKTRGEQLSRRHSLYVNSEHFCFKMKISTVFRGRLGAKSTPIQLEPSQFVVCQAIQTIIHHRPPPSFFFVVYFGAATAIDAWDNFHLYPRVRAISIAQGVRPPSRKKLRKFPVGCTHLPGDRELPGE